jgi:hypothetical protein
MSLIIKKNTTFRIPRTGSTAPAGFGLPATLTISIPADGIYSESTFKISNIDSFNGFSYPVDGGYDQLMYWGPYSYDGVDYSGLWSFWNLYDSKYGPSLIHAYNTSSDIFNIPLTNWKDYSGNPKTVTITTP